MNWARLWAQTNMIMRGHVFNWLWRNRRKRHAVRAQVLSEVIPNYLRRYLPAAAAVVESPVVRDDKNEKIWTLWLQGEDKAPPLVQACFRSVRKNCKQELVVLDEKSILFGTSVRPVKLVMRILRIFVVSNCCTSMVEFGWIQQGLRRVQFQNG